MLLREHAKIGPSSSTTVTDFEDKKRMGRPSVEIEEQLTTYLVEQPRASSVEIAKAFGMSQATVWRHLVKMGLKQVCCRWVPHNLSEDNRACRMRICNELLVKHANDNFLPHLVTADETWIMWRNEGTFKQTKCWAGGDIEPGRNVSKKLTPAESMAIFFWDSRGIIFWHLLQQKETIMALIYCQMLEHIENEIKEKRCRSLRNSNHFMHLQHDNATPP